MLTLALTFVATCFTLGRSDNPLTASSTLLQLVQNNPELTTLETLVKESPELTSLLLGKGPLTLFAPTDDAFKQIPEYKLNYLQAEEQKSVLVEVLKYHVVSGRRETSTFSSGVALPTLLNNSSLNTPSQLSVKDSTCTTAEIEKSNIQASNGILHIIDSLLLSAGTICPDSIIVGEQRSEGKIMSYPHDCRSTEVNAGKGTILAQGQNKPVGMTFQGKNAARGTTRRLYWSNDYDYPSGSSSSWISQLETKNLTFKNATLAKIAEKVVDPQGMDIDPTHADHLYWGEHLGSAVRRLALNTTTENEEDELKPELVFSFASLTNQSFQPADVGVDITANKLVITAENNDDRLNGHLWIVDDFVNATLNERLSKARVLRSGLIKNYGLCLDRDYERIYYVQGGNDGYIACVHYNGSNCSTPVNNALQSLASGLAWPYMCDTDSTYRKYGGPTYMVYTEANRPGSTSVIEIWEDGKTSGANKTIETDLQTDRKSVV